MRRLKVFENVSLDGCFVDAHGDMSWAHRQDPEWNAFVAENAKGGGALVLARVTYEQMAGFWPTPAGRAASAVVSERMTAMAKYVFSRSLARASWANTHLVKGDAAEVIGRLVRERGPDLVVLGSGSVVAQLADADAIDEYQLVVHPLALGGGRSLFEGLRAPRRLALDGARTFANGCVVLTYRRA